MTVLLLHPRDKPDKVFNLVSELPAGMTHSRAGPATQYDSSGTLIWGPCNMFRNSGTLGTQNVTLIAGQSYTVSFYGTGSVVYQGVTLQGTGANVRVSGSFVATGGSTSFTVSGSVTSAQLEPTSWDSPKSYNATTSAQYHGPRFDYDPGTLVPLGLFIEGSRRNLQVPSNVNSWTYVSNASITANSAVSPMGTMDACTLTDTTSNTSHIVASYLKVNTVIGTVCTLYAFMKKGTANCCQLYVDTGMGGFLCNFDLNQGIKGYTNATSSFIRPLANGWYQVGMTFTAAAVTTSTYIGFINEDITTTQRGPAYIGTGKTLYAWGYQFEASTGPTSYIPTYGSGSSGATTRAADVGPAGLLSTLGISATEGTITVDVTLPYISVSALHRYFFGLDDGTDQNLIAAGILSTGVPLAENINAGVLTLSGLNITVPSRFETFRAVRTYKNADNQFKVTGVTATDGAMRASTVPTATTLHLASGTIADRELFGWIKNFKVWNTANINR